MRHVVHLAAFVLALFLVPGTISAAPPWDIPAGAKTLEANGYEMAYIEKGTGTPLLIIHGTGQDYRYFAASMDALAARHRVIALSLRFHYPHPWDGKGNYSIAGHADDVVSFVRTLNSGPVHLVGHSYGGTVAYFAARSAPNLFRSVTSVEGMTNSSIAPPQTEENNATWVKLQSVFEGGDVEEALRYFIRAIGGDWDKVPEPTRQGMRANAWTIYANSKLPAEEVSCQPGGGLAVPFLLLQGEKTSSRYGETLDSFAKCLSRVERVTIPGAAHVLPRTHPAEFTKTVLDFAAKH